PWSEAVRRFFGAPHKDKIWRGLFVLFAHTTSHLTLLAMNGRLPDRTIEGEPWVAPSRGFLVKDYTPEREAFYRPSRQAGVCWMMREYAAAASASEGTAYWMKLAIEESRRLGAVFIQALCNRDAAAELVIGGSFEDAVESGVFAGRGMVVQRAIGPLTRE